MRRLFSLKLAFASLFIAACVTINVYFPAAAAEKAADKIITDVLGEAPPQGNGTPAPKEDPGGMGGESASSLRSGIEPRFGPGRLLAAGAEGLLNFLVSPANAQAADLDISSPAIRAITASMKQRNDALRKYYDSGAVGFTADGMVEVRDQNAVPLPERGEVRRLVAELNKDHAALYSEIARANNHPEWESDIRKTFGERYAARAKQSGWYFKDASGTWTR